MTVESPYASSHHIGKGRELLAYELVQAVNLKSKTSDGRDFFETTISKKTEMRCFP